MNRTHKLLSRLLIALLLLQLLPTTTLAADPLPQQEVTIQNSRHGDFVRALACGNTTIHLAPNAIISAQGEPGANHRMLPVFAGPILR